jgi:hypothetical protein
MLYTVYVDSLSGSDINTGELTSPVATLSYALSQVYEGGIIVLQDGTGSSYGNLTVTKNVTIKAAYGSAPEVGSLTLSGIQGLIEGLSFSNIATGISITNTSFGSIIVRECKFNSVVTAVNIKYVNYVSLHRNYFFDFDSAVKIDSAEEVCLSSNVFSNGKRPIDITTVNRLDLWKNTIFGAYSLPPVPFPDTNLRIIYKTLTAFDITYKRIQLPGFASLMTGGGGYDIAFNVVNGPSFNYGTDFIAMFSGSLVSWSGLQLEQEFAVGDVVRVMYSETGDIDPGDAIRVQNIGDVNSRIDSNSISSNGSTPVGRGVYLNTPVKIRYNNFDDVAVWWDGAAPTGATGMYNIGETAMYRDPFIEDFRLQPESPNIDKADSDRWNNIYSEMGITKNSFGYTSSYTGIVRDHVSPFDRDIDFDLFHRGATGIQGLTGDIGALEFNENETAMGNYVAEYGFDKAYPGTETGPYASPDRGYQRSGINDLYIATNVVPSQDSVTDLYTFYTSGSSYSRFRSKDVVLSDSDLVIGTRTRNDVVVIYPSHPTLGTDLVYVSPDGNDSWTGSLGAPYRTIGRALLDAGSQYVLVEPGYYPSFRGVTGIHLVGTERFTGIDLGGILYSNMRDSTWTGTGTYSYDKDDMSLTSPNNVMGEFSLSSGADIKLFATVKSDSLMIKLSNVDNSVYLKINRSMSVITYGYVTGGMSYEINSAISDGTHTLDELFSNLKVRFLFKNNKFSIYLNGAYIHGSYANVFASGSVTDWVLQFISTGTGLDTISNLSTLSSSIPGATGVNSVVTLKKLFGITGATGIQV